MTPYFHSKIPVSVKKFRVIVIIRLIIIGIISYAIAMYIGNGWLLLFGIIFIISAFGDILIIWLMRNLKPNEMGQDHPDKIGLIVLK